MQAVRTACCRSRGATSGTLTERLLALVAGWPRERRYRGPAAGLSRNPELLLAARGDRLLPGRIERIESQYRAGVLADASIEPVVPTRWLYQNGRDGGLRHRRMRRSLASMCPRTGKRIHTPDALRCMTLQLWLTWQHLRPRLSDLIQSRDIDFGVDLCGLNGAMPKNCSDILQRCTLAQQGSGNGVPQQMRGAPAWRCDASPTHRFINDHRDGVMGGERAERCTTTDEHAVRVGGRPTMQVVDEGISHLLSQGQPCLAAAFAAHLDPSVLPVKIAQMQIDDIAGAKP